jgi:hypothetical protein
VTRSVSRVLKRADVLPILLCLSVPEEECLRVDLLELAQRFDPVGVVRLDGLIGPHETVDAVRHLDDRIRIRGRLRVDRRPEADRCT